ncbi:pimeloyl-CoA dehydrogenase small subunit [Cupriavidus sp. USMAA2-4]|uniref:Pimeloyl-CoA dehydrogenase small subunit n=1 Tax=Cupriavidus malaysiensis TaxID=367825 RepID=A0A1D9I9T5_9BURK|nr:MULTISPECIES: acyl-CoA dehydrogenase family protein [Cupriavidus]AOY95690.1 pimeloyl-CoA dehydrogenase small subunit [Cupriavidus sp. USMAA2-4]AOZ01437.1 pimeloyl-CoA dehydrogenase small subunit [Cupriavidus sp. USMAHM13]AOZ08840.1 pimeloyl-CoA dehydrogenase small subunit [Cupriavidus malaysiensis]
MDFQFSEEQAMLRDTLARFLADHYDFEARQAGVHSAAGWRPAIWKALASQLGLLGAGLPERFGGLGGGAVEHAIVMELFGRHLVVEPYLSSIVLGAGALAEGSPALAQAWVPALIGGEAVAAWAHAEPAGRYCLSDVQTRAERQGQGWRLSGRKRGVVAAPWATHFVVSARSAGARRDSDGISLFWIPREARGLSLREYPTIDGARAAELDLDQVEVGAADVIGEAGAAFALVEHLNDQALAALAAEAAGAMQRMLADTVDYARQRKQFGVPIGTFQALQHRMADMYVQAEQASALSLVAAMQAGASPRERALAASAAKAQAGLGGKFVGQAAVQIHGGMGVTEELAVGHYFKRVTAIDLQHGSAEHHLRRYADLLYPAGATGLAHAA